MSLLATLLSLALLVDGTLGDSSARTLAFKKHLNLNRSGSGKTNIVHADRARIAELAKGMSSKKRSYGGYKSKPSPKNTIPASSAGVTYTASVGVGCPPTDYNLFIDSGSAFTWVGHNKSYVRTETSIATGDKIFLSYGDGTVNGLNYLDKITLSPSLTVENQSIGVDDRTGTFISHGGVTLDGILGIGPVWQTTGVLTTQPSNTTVPTVSNNLLAEKKIAKEAIGVYYTPWGSANNATGELSFGGPDASKYTGNIAYTSSQADDWYISNSMAVGNSTFLTGSGLVDTGTILIYLSEPQFNGYLIAANASYQPSYGMVSITEENFAKLQPLNIDINGTIFSLNADAQAWPRSLNSLIGLPTDEIFLIVSTYGNTFPFQFIMGLTFMERFYTVFDTTNQQIGFATTAHTYDVVNQPSP